MNKSISNPIYFDNKEDRARPESRPHLLKTKGGYPVEKLVGIADLPVYYSLDRTQCILSTPNRPSGPLLEEKDKESDATRFSEPNEIHLLTNHPQESQLQLERIFLSTPERSSDPSLEERSQNVSNQATSHTQSARTIQLRDGNADQVIRRSVLLSQGSNRRFEIIGDSKNKASVFERLGTRRTP